MSANIRSRYQIQLPGHILDLGKRTLIMGVLNVTPDSFSDGGKFFEPSRAVRRAWEIAEEGADILDIGGESARPGAKGISAEEEIARIAPVLQALGGKYPLPISIDTSKGPVARAALDLGAAIINDVSGLRFDPALAQEAARSGAGLILMHMRGTPLDMQKLAPSPDIVLEIEVWVEDAVALAESRGVSCEKVILDPGIGFGKTARQNLEILRSLNRLAAAGFPLLVGTSRKSFIGAVLGNPYADRIWGTAASVSASIIFGAHIVRVHDVAAMRDVARITDAIIDDLSTE